MRFFSLLQDVAKVFPRAEGARLDHDESFADQSRALSPTLSDLVAADDVLREKLFGINDEIRNWNEFFVRSRDAAQERKVKATLSLMSHSHFVAFQQRINQTETKLADERRSGDEHRRNGRRFRRSVSERIRKFSIHAQRNRWAETDVSIDHSFSFVSLQRTIKRIICAVISANWTKIWF